MLKFLPGILLIQLITSGLVILIVKWLENIDIVITLSLFTLIVGFLTAFWFAAVARDMQKDQLVRLKDRHARDREKILLHAERDKANIATEAYQTIAHETQRIHSKANVKVGAAFTAVIAVGGVMLLTQFITVGLILMVGSGSGLVGYLMRIRQERLAYRKQPIIEITQPSNAPLLKKDKI